MKILVLLITLLSYTLISAQKTPFELELEEVSIDELGGIQSYAFAQHDGKWLIVGGRLDGLHERQPWASFDVAGHNNQLIVIDPVAQQKWTAALASLPASIQEQLSSTNMEFYQKGDYLYCLGGYGRSDTHDDHITFPNLTAVDVPQCINAVINSTNIEPYFRQVEDSLFQVSGGKLKRIDDTFYLLGGHLFIGKYNPLGPDFATTFVQEYTNAIRPFTLEDDGNDITINHLNPYIDTLNLHRRDYNAEAQIMPDGSEGVTMFSGVFQVDADLPFLNSVNVIKEGYAVNNDFEQLYNHYHCPVLNVYSEEEHEMHSVFFGGLAQFYDDEDGNLVQDDQVPFVKTIARVSRDKDGVMTETKLALEMPSLLGTGAEFIPNLDFPHYRNGVFHLDSLGEEKQLIGYIYGGISSTAANIFFINDGTLSEASSQIFKVYISPKGIAKISDKSLSNVFEVFPNPSNGIINIKWGEVNGEIVKLTVYDISGNAIPEQNVEHTESSKQTYLSQIRVDARAGLYFVKIETRSKTVVKQFVIR